MWLHLIEQIYFQIEINTDLIGKFFIQSTLFIFEPHLGHDILLCSLPHFMQKYLTCRKLLSD